MLARQHFENFNKHFCHIPSALLTSSLKDKKETMNRLNSNDVSIVFGTHILSSESVIFDKLGLVVIDEQHKFGVETRENLIKKALQEIQFIFLQHRSQEVYH
nr:DEAD/DEAH box helicase [Acholeplasma laidlawii]